MTATKTRTATATPTYTPTRVGQADLVETLVGNPPAALRLGSRFIANDTVHNRGTAKSVVTTTHYYLLDAGISVLLGRPDGRPFGDFRDSILQLLIGFAGTPLVGNRDIPALVTGAPSAGITQLTVPNIVSAGKYFLVACTDDARKVSESDEANNCTASAATVQVAK
jgi:hypothetical protein